MANRLDLVVGSLLEDSVQGKGEAGGEECEAEREGQMSALLSTLEQIHHRTYYSLESVAQRLSLYSVNVGAESVELPEGLIVGPFSVVVVVVVIILVAAAGAVLLPALR